MFVYPTAITICFKCDGQSLDFEHYNDDDPKPTCFIEIGRYDGDHGVITRRRSDDTTPIPIVPEDDGYVPRDEFARSISKGGILGAISNNLR